MMQHNRNQSAKTARARRVRVKLQGTAERPRVSVFRSNRFVWVQAIDDTNAIVLASASDHGVRTAGKKSELKVATAQQTGVQIAEQLKKKSISKALFDRGSYRYHGRVAAVAQGLREAGVEV